MVLEGDRVIAVEALRGLSPTLRGSLAPAASALDVLECWELALPALQQAADLLARADSKPARSIAARTVPMAALTAHAPVAARQILLSGANYFKHVVDLIVDLGPGKTPGTEGMDSEQLRAYGEDLMRRRQRDGSPYVFSKPITALAGAFEPIVLPSFTQQADWELELAVVMSSAARNVSRDTALDHVAGYMIVNDLTNRDHVWAKGDMKPMGTDWITSKSCPGYLPAGPYMVPARHAGNPADMHLDLRLNGQIMQSESTRDMIFDVPRLIEHISSVVQLLPGDVICTGSPAGNGTHHGRFLRAGDLVEATITGLGAQRTPVTSDSQ